MSSVMREMLAAGPGCAVANGLLNSFETTKVKLQLLDPHTMPRIYRQPTMRGVMNQIIKEEGFVAGLVTPGLSASLVRSMVYGGYRVGLYSSIRDHLVQMSSSTSPTSSPSSTTGTSSSTIGLRLTSGMVTGAIGSFITCPLDVVRTRMQADAGVVCSVKGVYTTGLRKGRPVRYSNLFTTFYEVYKTEGLVNGLYRGALVTVTRASLLNGAQLASYDTLKRFVAKDKKDESYMLHICCAAVSGILAQTVVMPIDAIKSCMMVGNGWDTVRHNITRHGPLWFYRGYAPAAANQGLIMVLQMPLIESFRKLLGVEAI
mmetsp:Transcript_46649/g.113674  ORF Transcript_46649/g.113674 Transcript_46649/m.113674 type:complete len:316 (-) Transcript_46649:1984-2931(-)